MEKTNIIKAIAIAVVVVTFFTCIVGAIVCGVENSEVECSIIACEKTESVFGMYDYDMTCVYNGIEFDIEVTSGKNYEVGGVYRVVPSSVELAVTTVACGDANEVVNGYAKYQSTMNHMSGNHTAGILWGSVSRISSDCTAVVEYNGEHYAIEVNREYSEGTTLYISLERLINAKDSID